VEYEDRITISTPEGIELEHTLAGLGSRFIAEGVDIVVRLIVLGALILVLRLIGASSAALVIALILGGFLALFAYDVAFEVWGGGRTPGKRWSGLRVLMASGQPVSLGPSAVRNLLRIVDEWATALIAGIVSILLSGRNQRLGDLAAGTIVVRERHARATAPLTEVPPVPSALEPGLDVTAVSASELGAIRDFLVRRERLTPDARARVARMLADGIRGSVGGLPPGGLEAERLLEAIVAAKATSR
jgi:uncharacterized RDD family membrane protein YckC